MHGKALLRTSLDACAALDASEPADLPGRLSLVDRDGRCRAFLRAEAAKDTILDRNCNRTACADRVLAGDGRIQPRRRFPEQISQCDPHKTDHIFSYLSVQLIQGSIVNIRIGTSANWQPFRTSISPGRLAKVGVRTRMRSRFLDPFALT